MRKNEISNKLFFIIINNLIGEKTLRLNYSNLATSFINIVIVCEHLKQFQLSLQYLEKSLQMKLLSLSCQHPHIATVCERQNHILEAISYCQKNIEYFSEKSFV